MGAWVLECKVMNYNNIMKLQDHYLAFMNSNNLAKKNQ